MMNFAGWQLPAYYRSPDGGAIREHHHVRRHCGVFDISHMGQIQIQGKDAYAFIDFVIPTRIDSLGDKQSLYSCLLNHQGTIIDDVIIYRFDPKDFMLCVNASRRDEVLKWITHLSSSYECKILDLSDQYAMLAIQGPECLKTLHSLIDKTELRFVSELSFMHFCVITLNNTSCILSRGGYTGELGYELIMPSQPAFCEPIFDRLIQAPSSPSSASTWPCGLVARNSLRLEAGFLLYGHDMDHTTHPQQVGLDWLMSSGPSSSYSGQQALENICANQINTARLYGFLMDENAIARSGHEVYDSNRTRLGVVTSGAYLPTLNRSGGLALCIPDLDINTEIMIDMRSKKRKASLAQIPFYPSKARQPLNL